MLMLGERMLVTASSSDSKIKIWKVSTNVAEEIECIGSVDTTCRVTCMSVWHKGLRVGGKRKGGKLEETETVSPKKKIKTTETEPNNKSRNYNRRTRIHYSEEETEEKEETIRGSCEA